MNTNKDIDMREVGIKILKDNLSRYLKLVKEGEIIYIKDRKEIIAEIRKPTIKGLKNTRLENYIQEQLLKGNLFRAKSEGIDLNDIAQLKKLRFNNLNTAWKSIYDENRNADR